jgi:hypothetical protein
MMILRMVIILYLQLLQLFVLKRVMTVMHIIAIITIIADFFLMGWLKSVGSRVTVVYELNYKEPVLYVIPIQSILGKLFLVPVGDTGTIPHRMCNTFAGAPGARRPGAGDDAERGSSNSWALGYNINETI